MIRSGGILWQKRSRHSMFTALHHPHGQDFPTGTVLTVTYDAKTMRITDVGFDTAAPDLHAIDANVVDLMAP